MTDREIKRLAERAGFYFVGDTSKEIRASSIDGLAELAEFARLASPAPEALPAGEAESEQKNVDRCLNLLADIRDLFPIPTPGSDLESIWTSAIGDPESVPEYVKACLAASAAPALEPGSWSEAQRIGDLPAVDEALRGFSEDPTGDNATCLVRTILNAAPVAPLASTAAPEDRESLVRDGRNAALEEAAQVCDRLTCRPEFEPDFHDKLLMAASKAIRGLKLPTPEKRRLSMSMFATKADYDAALQHHDAKEGE